MAQEEEKKEEEKFEFDAAGEALGYISMDQARVQAIEHARETKTSMAFAMPVESLYWRC